MSRRVQPTKVSTLAFIAVGVGVIAWAVVRAAYGDIPPLQWFVPIWVGVVALGEVFFGWRLRRQIRRAPGTEPPEPIVAARSVALAKASAIVGAALVGMWGGALAYLAPQWGHLAAAAGDALVSLIGVLLSVGLVAAALFLEYCCRAPDLPEDEPGAPA